MTLNSIGTLLTGKLFVVVISLFYIAIKILIRHLIHRLIGHNYDKWAVFAWSWVDIAVLTLSLCINTNVTKRLQLTDNEIALWYITLAVCIFLSALCYGFFIRRKNETSGVPPLKDLKTAFFLTMTIFFGIAFFIPTMMAI